MRERYKPYTFQVLAEATGSRKYEAMRDRDVPESEAPDLAAGVAAATSEYGAVDRQTLELRTSYARSLLARGDHDLALEEWTRVLHACTGTLGADALETTFFRGERATALSAGGRHREALAERTRVLGSYTALLGLAHPETLVARANRAVSLSLLGRYEDGLSEETRVVDARTQLFGAEHPLTMTTRANRAITLIRLGRYEEALNEAAWLVEARTRVLGVDHDETLTARAIRASVFLALGSDEEALSEEDWVVDARERTQGSEHLETVRARSNRSVTLHRLGRYEAALEDEDWVAEVRSRNVGPEHPTTIVARLNRAATLRELGRFDEAHSEGTWVVETQNRVLGALHPDTLLARMIRAVVLQDLGFDREACDELDQVADLCCSILGPDHPMTGRSLLQAGRAHGEAGDVPGGISAVLQGIAVVNGMRYRLSDARFRESWRIRWDASIALALSYALKMGDGRLLAELVETSRVQGVPQSVGEEPEIAFPPEGVPFEDDGNVCRDIEAGRSRIKPTPRLTRGDVAEASIRLVGGGDPLCPPPVITVEGRSALSDALRAIRAEASGESSDQQGVREALESPSVGIEEVVNWCVPPDTAAAWWGSWVVGGWLYQSLLIRDQTGEFRCELVPGVDWAPGLSESVGAWGQASERFLSAWQAGSSSGGGPLYSARGEAEILWPIAQQLLPAALVEKTREAITTGTPLWIVAAPALELARVPLAFLPIDPPTGHGQAVNRMVDGAVFVYSPSAALHWAIRERHPVAVDPERRVAVSVANPRDNLANARPVSPADRMLCGSEAAEASEGIATRENVLDALSAADGGIAHFAAHARWDTTRPADAALLLANDDVLAARDLLYTRRAIRASTAILACCSTIGINESNAEWLGLAPAFLWAGATTVVATQWPIRDHPQAAHFEQELVDSLLGGVEDSALALRSIQQRHLDRWRSGHHRSESTLHPLDFAAHIAIRR